MEQRTVTGIESDSSESITEPDRQNRRLLYLKLQTSCQFIVFIHALLSFSPPISTLNRHSHLCRLLILSNYEKRELQHQKAVLFRQLLVCSTCFTSTLRLIDLMHHYSPCVVPEWQLSVMFFRHFSSEWRSSVDVLSPVSLKHFIFFCCQIINLIWPRTILHQIIDNLIQIYEWWIESFVLSLSSYCHWKLFFSYCVYLLTFYFGG